MIEGKAGVGPLLADCRPKALKGMAQTTFKQLCFKVGKAR